MAYVDLLANGETSVGPATFRSRLLLRFTSLEWAAVLIARHDGFCSLGPGRASLPLADAKLEALRRAAVYAWHGHGRLPEVERLAFTGAGYSDADYGAMAADLMEMGGRTRQM
jgi:hypothetical protein